MKFSKKPVPFSIRKQQIFLYELNLLLQSGVMLAPAIRQISMNEFGKSKRRLLAIFDSINNGASLSVSLEKSGVFHQTIVRLVAAGEAVNQLQNTTQLCYEWLERTTQWSHSMKKLISYPLLLLLVSMGSVLLATYWLLPQLLFLRDSGLDLSWSTHFFLWIAQLQTENWVILFFFVGVLASLFFSIKKSVWLSAVLVRTGLLGRIFLYQDLSRFCHHMSASMSVRLNVPEALQQSTSLFHLSVMRVHADGMVNAVLQGKSLYEAISNHPCMPKMISDIIRTVRGSHNQSVAWKNLAKHCETTAERSLDRVQPLIEPVLMLLIGSIIILFIHAIILPLYQSEF